MQYFTLEIKDEDKTYLKIDLSFYINVNKNELLTNNLGKMDHKFK